MNARSLRVRGNVRLSKKRWCIMWLGSCLLASRAANRGGWITHWFPGLICPGKGQGYMCKRVNTSNYKSVFANWILWAVTLVSLMTWSSPLCPHLIMVILGCGGRALEGGSCLSGEDLFSGPLLKLIKQVLHLDHCSTKCVPGGK